MSAPKRVKGLTISRPILVGNTARPLTQLERESESIDPNHTHRWTFALRSPAPPASKAEGAAAVSTSRKVGGRRVPGIDEEGVEGGDDLALGTWIKKVTVKLHETYSNPMRTLEQPPFVISETGWGEFELVIRVHFVPESGERPLTMHHMLKLHPWKEDLPAPLPPPSDPTAPPLAPPPRPPVVHSWQYDEIVFTDPYESFYQLLLAHPPAPLAPQGGAKPHGYIVSQEMEAQEGARLVEARKNVVNVIGRLREKLIKAEKELEALKTGGA